MSAPRLFIKKIIFFPKIYFLLLFHNYEKALAICNDYLKIMPDNFIFYEYIALIHKRSGQINEAIEAYRKAISLFPNVLADKLDLIELLYKAEKYDEVVNYTTEVLLKEQKGLQERLKSTFFDTLYWYLAFSYMALKNYEEAVRFFENLRLTRYKKEINIYRSLGYCYQELDKIDKAIEAYQIALKLGCDDKKLVEEINRMKQETS